MAARRTTFRLMVSWDRAVVALDRALHQNRDRYMVVERDNGFLRLRRHDGVIITVEIRIETPTTTVLTVAGRRKGMERLIPGRNRVQKAVNGFRDDIVAQMLGALTPA